MKLHVVIAATDCSIASLMFHACSISPNVTSGCKETCDELYLTKHSLDFYE